MKIQTILLLLFLALFSGCNNSDEGASQTSVSVDASASPQPIVEDESLRPPKAPSL